MSELTIQYLPVTKIVLDQRNPRVAPALESIEGEPPQNFIELGKVCTTTAEAAVVG